MFESFLFVFAYCYAFWLLFVFTMGIYRAYLCKRLSIYSAILASPFLLLAGACDIFANWVVATILFLDEPQELLLTQRFIRYLRVQGETSLLWRWRIGFARFVCDKLLDVFDPDGNHCEDLSKDQASTSPLIQEHE